VFVLRLPVLAGCAVHLVITLAVDTGTVATAGRCCNSLATVQLAGSAVLLWVESVLLIKSAQVVAASHNLQQQADSRLAESVQGL
jgi:hypothetical protein